MKTFKQLKQEVTETCWKGYKQVGGKMKNGKMVPNCVPVKEAKDSGEYDYEGDMAMSQLKSVITNAKKLHDMLKPNTNLPEWVQSKITLAEDYIVTAANYMESELSEETIVEGGNYGEPYNNDEDLNSKSNTELQRLHDFWKTRIEKDPNHSRAKGQLTKIKAILAGKIGRNMKEETEHTNCDTPECCGKCDTSKVEELQERGANKYKRSTESGAGLTRAGVMKYRRKNPGSKLSTAVTTPPSKLKKGSKAANRRKSFCARMSGVKGPMKDEKGRPTRKAMSLRRWNCN
jgi:hypothetical protein